MKVPQYEQRVARIQKPGDAQKELERAKRYMMRMRAEARKASSLKRKLEILDAEKEAATVLRKMRQMIYELEDLEAERSRQ